MRTALLCALLVSSAAWAQGFVIAPVEKALERVSLGPLVSTGLSASRDGLGAEVAVGLGATVFDRFVVENPECEKRRAEERRRLGADKVPIWGDVVTAIQQECRPLAEHWWPAYDFGAEAGLRFGGARGGTVRAWVSPVTWRWFSLGPAISLPWSRGADGTVFGMRAGLELAAHLRIVSGKWRPDAVVFLRPEATVLERTAFADQAVLGARFLFDL